MNKNILNLLPIPLAFILLSCGSHTGSGTDSNDGQNPVAAPSVPVVSNQNDSGNSPDVLKDPTSNCPQYPSRDFYEYAMQGTGNVSRDTKINDIVADQKLRVSIEPLAAGTNVGNGGSMNYNKMAVTVTLLKNGAPIASKPIPGQTVDAQGFKRGIVVGVKSNPNIADFSSYLSGNAHYSIRVSAVMTDYKCNTFCTGEYYGCGYDASYCTYGANMGYNWNYDYHSGQYYCCAGTNLQTCQKQQCGVGPTSGLNNMTWNLNVRVETDNTTCIQP